ncbi:MAG: PQQ-dependent sugar dehydrogenase [Akkermansiaceae bacterium]|nr:PQQ-dependent sugar dehydrogenase [Armatimonadota bacterium]
MRYRFLVKSAVGLIALGSVVAASPASARPALPGFEITGYASGISSPTAMAFAPDGRLFVAEQGGNLRVIKNGVTQATPFATLAVNSVGERGFLGITFDPDFASNGFVYLYHTEPAPLGGAPFNRVSRFTANGDVAVAGSRVTLLNLEGLGPTNHNGGAIHFGADGKLYVAVGDNATPSNAQSLNNRLGKILRINADGTIPEDNPFFATATGDNRSIYALGLRNPFTFGVQSGTGLTYVNDVGQNTWEEVNVLGAGRNFGWGSGGGANEGPFDPAAFPTFAPPLVAYEHGSGTERGFSIAGGAFYNPAVNSFGTPYLGDYFYADFVNGWIRSVDAGTGNTSMFASGLGNITDLQVGSDGALYYTNRQNGSVGRINAIVTVPEASTLALVGVAALGITLKLARRRR